MGHTKLTMHFQLDQVAWGNPLVSMVTGIESTSDYTESNLVPDDKTFDLLHVQSPTCPTLQKGLSPVFCESSPLSACLPKSLAESYTDAMSVDLPRRGRRSSISERIQRVFHVDRLDKVCFPVANSLP